MKPTYYFQEAMGAEAVEATPWIIRVQVTKYEANQTLLCVRQCMILIARIWMKMRLSSRRKHNQDHKLKTSSKPEKHSRSSETCSRRCLSSTLDRNTTLSVAKNI